MKLAGVVVVAYMDNIETSILRLTKEVTAVVSPLHAKLAGIGVIVNDARVVAPPLPGHVPEASGHLTIVLNANFE